MYIDRDFPPPTGRLAQFARLLATFERDEIEIATELLIARMDAADGDPDLEPEEDLGAEDQGECGSWPEGTHGQGTAYTPADDDDEETTGDLALRQRHRDRVRRTRCDPRRYGRYTLREGAAHGL